jgi:hypothetical protein
MALLVAGFLGHLWIFLVVTYRHIRGLQHVQHMPLDKESLCHVDSNDNDFK